MQSGISITVIDLFNDVNHSKSSHAFLFCDFNTKVHTELSFLCTVTPLVETSAGNGKTSNYLLFC